MPSAGGRASAEVISIDVGGTGLKCALVDANHQVRHTERHPTGRERGPQAVLETIYDVATSLRDRAAHPVAIGLVVPGVIDEPAGVVRFAANLGFRDVPLQRLVSERLGVPVVLGHDVRAGGLAEARLGAGQGVDHVLFLPIGTGIAAAHVCRGVVTAGGHGAAGELGHVIVRPGGPQCGCGLRGCLEAVASAAAVQRRYAEIAGPSGGGRTAAEIAARLGTDPGADQVWSETVAALADGLLTAQALYDVELIIVGGGLAEAGETLLGPLRDALEKRLTFHRMPRMVRAALGDEAGCLGAALLAWNLK